MAFKDKGIHSTCTFTVSTLYHGVRIQLQNLIHHTNFIKIILKRYNVNGRQIHSGLT